MATRKLNIIIAGDSSGAQRAFAQADAAAGEMDSGIRAKLRSVGERFQAIGASMMRVGTKMSLAITLPVIALGRASLDHAREARVAMSEVNTIFGDSASVVKDWAREHAHSLGMSEAQMVSLSNASGGLGLTLGMTGGEAAMFSVGTNEIAAALSNARPDVGNFEEAIEDLSGGFFGNREQLKKWGLNIKQADIDAKLAEKGLSDLTGEARNQAQAWAILEIAQDGSKLSMDRWRKDGIDPALEAQNRLKAETREASEEFGKNLEPIVQKVQKALTGLMKAFNNLSPGMQQAITYGVLIAATLGPLLVIGGMLVKAIGAIMIALAALSAPVLIVIAIIAALVAAIVLLIIHWDKVKAAMAAVFDWIKGAASSVLDWLKTNWPLLLPIILGPIGIVAALVIKHWDKIKNGVMAAVDAVRGAISKGFNAVKDFISKWWPLIIGIFTGGLGTLVVLVVRNWSTIRQRTVAIFNAVRDFFVRIWNAIRDWVVRTVGDLRDRVVGVFTNARDRMRDIIQTARQWVVDRVRGMRDTVANVATDLKDKVLDRFRKMRDGIRDIWQKIRDTAANLWRRIKGAVKSPINSIIGFINKLTGGINTIIGKIPGIDISIPKIPKLAAGGMVDPNRTGPFKTAMPRAIVGEGSNAHAEYVIPTDPRFKSRALQFMNMAAHDLGFSIPAMQFGGIIGGAKKWVGDRLGDIGGFLRKGAAMAVFGPINEAVKAAINGLPNVLHMSDIAHSVREMLYNWVKGVEEGLPEDPPTGATGRGAGVAGLREPVASIAKKMLMLGAGMIHIVSGWRSSAQQAVLYARYLAGRGNLAAPPGRSKHERGLAVDWGGNRAVYQRLAHSLGAHFPVRGEPWHMEVPGFHSGGDVARDGLGRLQRGERVFSRREVKAMDRGLNVELRITGDSWFAQALHRVVRTGDAQLFANGQKVRVGR